MRWLHEVEVTCTYARTRGMGGWGVAGEVCTHVTQTRHSRRTTNCLLLFQVIQRELMTGPTLIITCIWWQHEVCFKPSLSTQEHRI